MSGTTVEKHQTGATTGYIIVRFPAPEPQDRQPREADNQKEAKA